jgi:hypothetical protein
VVGFGVEWITKADFWHLRDDEHACLPRPLLQIKKSWTRSGTGFRLAELLAKPDVAYASMRTTDAPAPDSIAAMACARALTWSHSRSLF